ncbi:hypothetical protein KKH39_02490 [Patescibacteria group bacterium]|nr:hypothetical protein [Patescibacteria group bacterium]
MYYSIIASALYCNNGVGTNAFRIVLQGGAANGFPYNTDFGTTDNKCI